MLTAKQILFIEHYLQCWVGAEAARRAGYAPKSARHAASQLLGKSEVQKYIAERLVDIQMQSNEVLARLTEQARGSIEDFVNEKGELDLAEAKKKGVLKLAKRIKISRGNTNSKEVELYDAQAALVHLGRTMALFTDKIAGSLEINYDDIAAEFDRRIAGVVGRSGAPSDTGHDDTAPKG